MERGLTPSTSDDSAGGHVSNLTSVSEDAEMINEIVMTAIDIDSDATDMRSLPANKYIPNKG